MFSRHEDMFRNGFRVITIPPREYRPTKSSVESREFLDATYLEGEKARKDRVPLSACPFLKDDPSSHNWQRGWIGARLAEVETPKLVAMLKRADFVASSRGIEQLDSQHRFELADWLEAAKDLHALEMNRPSWVLLNQDVSSNDPPTIVPGPRPISFEIRFPLPCVDDDDAADEPELPPLREQQPATREEALLQGLLRQFDDLGVQLVEEQWQCLSDQDQDAAIDWLNDRLSGQSPPVPAPLFGFATVALQGEVQPGISSTRNE